MKNPPLPRRSVERSCARFGVDVDRPLICQVSRFDPWKYPLGEIDTYRIVREDPPDVQLVLAGSMANDDPEGWQLLGNIVECAGGDRRRGRRDPAAAGARPCTRDGRRGARAGAPAFLVRRLLCDRLRLLAGHGEDRPRPREREEAVTEV